VIAHVFITNEDTFPVVRDNSFWGVGIKVRTDTINKFFNNENVTNTDEIVFSFNRRTYTAVAKILLITNE